MSSLKYKYLIVGASGTGKTQLVDLYNREFGTKQLLSYTTRIKRECELDSPTHIYVLPSIAQHVLETREIVAYTNYGDNVYFATMQQFKNCDFYVIDKNGIEYMKEKNIDIPFKIIFLYNSNFESNEARMAMRGSSKSEIEIRINIDSINFNYKELTEISDYQLDTCGKLEDVYEQFKNIISESEEN